MAENHSSTRPPITRKPHRHQAEEDLVARFICHANSTHVLQSLWRGLWGLWKGAQMMGFIGFPSETPEEAYNTYEFLVEHNDSWTLAGIGDFVLTQGSIVAKRYHDFGIQEIGGFEGDDIIRSLYWIDHNGHLRIPGYMRSPSINTIAALTSRFADDRPFVGGIDSNHSILYFAKYGRSLVPSELLNNSASKAITKVANYATPLKNVDEFLDVTDLAKFHGRKRYKGQAPDSNEILSWLAEYPEEAKVADGHTKEILEIYPSGRYLSQTDEFRKVEVQGARAYKTLKELMLSGSGVL